LALPAAALAFPGPTFEPLFEPGEVEILVGPAADRGCLLSKTIQLAA
jgi:beta-glucosidase